MEQTIAIMKNLLDNHTEGSSEHLGQASIETMMLNLVRSVILFVCDGPHPASVLQKSEAPFTTDMQHNINNRIPR